MAYWDRDLGELLRADQLGLKPQEAPSGTLQGAWIDRLAVRPSDGTKNVYDGAYITALTGAATGANPSVTFSVQDADDASGSNAAAYTPPNSSTAAALTMSGQTGSNSARGLAVDLSAARRYVNVKAVVAIDSGTLGVAAGVALGGAKYSPAL